jgi:hypothetical protein
MYGKTRACTNRERTPFMDQQENSELSRIHGTRLLPDESAETYRQKLARITLDSMVQFAGLLEMDKITSAIRNRDLTERRRLHVTKPVDPDFLRMLIAVERVSSGG